MIETKSRPKTENLSKDLRQGSSDSTVLDLIRNALSTGEGDVRGEKPVDTQALERHRRLTGQ